MKRRREKGGKTAGARGREARFFGEDALCNESFQTGRLVKDAGEW